LAHFLKGFQMLLEGLASLGSSSIASIGLSTNKSLFYSDIFIILKGTGMAGQVAIGKLAQLSVFGSDYDTHDGTGVRDYIHVVDLAVGHLKALQRHENDAGLHIYNLGTGHGYSVLDMVKAFEKANNITIAYKLVERRPGDIATCYSDPSLAAKELGWVAERGLEKMMQDTWNWQKNNPKGYRD